MAWRAVPIWGATLHHQILPWRAATEKEWSARRPGRRPRSACWRPSLRWICAMSPMTSRGTAANVRRTSLPERTSAEWPRMLYVSGRKRGRGIVRARSGAVGTRLPRDVSASMHGHGRAAVEVLGFRRTRRRILRNGVTGRHPRWLRAIYAALNDLARSRAPRRQASVGVALRVRRQSVPSVRSSSSTPHEASSSRIWSERAKSFAARAWARS